MRRLQRARHLHVAKVGYQGVDIRVLSFPFSLAVYGCADVRERVFTVLRLCPGQRPVLLVISHRGLPRASIIQPPLKLFDAQLECGHIAERVSVSRVLREADRNRHQAAPHHHTSVPFHERTGRWRQSTRSRDRPSRRPCKLGACHHTTWFQHESLEWERNDQSPSLSQLDLSGQESVTEQRDQG